MSDENWDEYDPEKGNYKDYYPDPTRRARLPVPGAGGCVSMIVLWFGPPVTALAIMSFAWWIA